MSTTLRLGDIDVDVVLKDIKNVHLSVYPPNGKVRIAAPERMKLETVRLYAISKLGWIKKQQKQIQDQERETPREFLERESHYVWGKRYLLQIKEQVGPTKIELKHRNLVMTVSPDVDRHQRQKMLDQWYREEVRAKANDFIHKWEPLIGVQVAKLYIQRMKTKWGSCNPVAHTIRLNAELAKKPLECLEYLVVHEMVHVLEPTHNANFQALLEHYMSNWKQCRQALNRLPVRHEDWRY